MLWQNTWGKKFVIFTEQKEKFFVAQGLCIHMYLICQKKKFLINEMLSQIKGNKNTIKVLNSKSRVDLLSANDAVEAIYKIMQLKNPNNFIISSKKLVTVKKLFLELKKKTNRNLKLVDQKKNILNKNNFLRGDNAKIKKICKWTPRDSLADIIDGFINRS